MKYFQYAKAYFFQFCFGFCFVISRSLSPKRPENWFFATSHLFPNIPRCQIAFSLHLQNNLQRTDGCLADQIHFELQRNRADLFEQNLCLKTSLLVCFCCQFEMKYSITFIKYTFALIILYKLISHVHIFDAD